MTAQEFELVKQGAAQVYRAHGIPSDVAEFLFQRKMANDADAANAVYSDPKALAAVQSLAGHPVRNAATGFGIGAIPGLLGGGALGLGEAGVEALIRKLTDSEPMTARGALKRMAIGSGVGGAATGLLGVHFGDLATMSAKKLLNDKPR